MSIDTGVNATRGEDELHRLVRWIETWNRVCNTADPCPSWEEVVDKELSDWNDPEDIKRMGADGWDAYMKQTLFHDVENYLYAVGRHPTHQKEHDASTPRSG